MACGSWVFVSSLETVLSLKPGACEGSLACSTCHVIVMVSCFLSLSISQQF